MRALLLCAVAMACHRPADPGELDQIPAECLSAAWPPSSGGVTWSAAQSSVTPASRGWRTLSSDDECRAIAPAAVPPQLSWNGPNQSWCASPVVNERGDIAVWSPVTQTAFFHSDGSGAVVADGAAEGQSAPSPTSTGFTATTFAKRLSCDFQRPLNGDFTPGRAVPISSRELIRTPSGYVEVRDRSQGAQDDTSRTDTQLLWLDDSFRPLGNWHTAVTLHGIGNNLVRRTLVDQRGNALVLHFVSPEMCGGCGDADTKFTARWMGPEGPLTDEFEPDLPKMAASWSTVIPLRDGGFAMFLFRKGGWSAYFPSAEARTAAVPAWMHAMDSSVQLVASGAAYAAVRRNAETDERTLFLMSPSGHACYSFSLGNADAEWHDLISPDGTVVQQDLCQLRWWPGLARIQVPTNSP